MKAVILTATYDNAGDHLHRHASIELLKTKIAEIQITEINRRETRLEKNQVHLKSADVIFMPGGPSFRPDLIPTICDLPSEYWSKTSLLGSGIKLSRQGKLNSDTLAFLQKCLPISVRDLATEQYATSFLPREKITMTGCPVSWLQDSHFATKLNSNPSVKIAVSDGQDYSTGANAIALKLAQSLPNATLIHHTKDQDETSSKVPCVFIKGDHQKLMSIYSQCSLHIGFRVHAHLACLASGVPSVLIAEDARGLSLNEQYGCQILPLTHWAQLMRRMKKRGLHHLVDIIADVLVRRILRQVDLDQVPVIQTNKIVDAWWDEYFASLRNQLSK